MLYFLYFSRRHYHGVSTVTKPIQPGIITALLILTLINMGMQMKNMKISLMSALVVYAIMFSGKYFCRCSPNKQKGYLLTAHFALFTLALSVID